MPITRAMLKKAIEANDTEGAVRLLDQVETRSPITKKCYEDLSSAYPSPPLIITAIENNNTAIVRALLRINNTDACDYAYGYGNPLDYAAGLGKIEVIQEILRHMPIHDYQDTTYSDYRDITYNMSNPIYEAAQRDHWDTVTAILQALNPKPGKRSPLQHGNELKMFSNLLEVLPLAVEKYPTTPSLPLGELLAAIETLFYFYRKEDSITELRSIMKTLANKGFSDIFLRLLNLSPNSALCNTLHDFRDDSPIETLAIAKRWATLKLTLEEPYLGKIRSKANFKTEYIKVMIEAIKDERMDIIKRLFDLEVFSIEAFDAARKNPKKEILDLFLDPKYGIIHQLAQKGDIDGLDVAIKHNPNLLKTRNDQDQDPLQIAANAGHEESARFLLHAAKIHFESELETNRDRYAPLLVNALSKKKYRLAADLIEQDIGLTHQDESSGYYAIHLLAQTAEKTLINALLRKNIALLSQKNHHGLNPLRVAEASGRKAIFIEATVELVQSYATDESKKEAVLTQLRLCIDQLEPENSGEIYFDLISTLETQSLISDSLTFVQIHGGLLSTFLAKRIARIDSETMTGLIKNVFDTENPQHAKLAPQLGRIKEIIAGQPNLLATLLSQIATGQEKAKLIPLAEILANYLISLGDNTLLEEAVNPLEKLGSFFKHQTVLLEKFRAILNPPSSAASATTTPDSLESVRRAPVTSSAASSSGLFGKLFGGARVRVKETADSGIVESISLMNGGINS